MTINYLTIMTNIPCYALSSAYITLYVMFHETNIRCELHVLLYRQVNIGHCTYYVK